MDVNTLKRFAQLSEWKDRVAVCRSSGLSVREWCKVNKICLQTYYRWEKVVLAAAENAQLQTMGNTAVTCNPAPAAPVFAELTPPSKVVSPVQHTAEIVATIRYGGVSIDLYAGVEPGFVVMLCKELQYAE